MERVSLVHGRQRGRQVVAILGQRNEVQPVGDRHVSRRHADVGRTERDRVGDRSPRLDRPDALPRQSHGRRPGQAPGLSELADAIGVDACHVASSFHDDAHACQELSDAASPSCVDGGFRLVLGDRAPETRHDSAWLAVHARSNDSRASGISEICSSRCGVLHEIMELVTTSEFSPHAVQAAHGEPNLKHVDGPKFVDMLAARGVLLQVGRFGELKRQPTCPT